MGNKVSGTDDDDDKARYRSFPGSAMLEKTFCGSIDTTDPAEYADVSAVNRLLKRAEILCVSSPVSSDGRGGIDDYCSTDDENSVKIKSPVKKKSLSGKLLARALVSEVTDNPKTMKQADMRDRERRLLRAAAAAKGTAGCDAAPGSGGTGRSKPVGAAAPPHVLRSMAFACTGDDDAVGELCSAAEDNAEFGTAAIPDGSANTVTIGVALSRRSEQGHPATVTRQTTFDWNELQDRQYKYVSATTGWMAGGGEPSGQPDAVHIPIIHIHCPTGEAAVDAVITALASGEIFIPHMSVLPEQLTVHNNTANGSADLVVTFGCERNDDLPVEEWPNWCLEFMHNQLYDYFSGSAVWMQRSFSITLAKQVRWKTVKHMNRYFSVSEKVVAGWREKGPQLLKPLATHLEGGASGDEVARPHGIYLFRKGVPTNYFAPNFAPPYTTKMTRSLLMTVLQKSWDKKRREWTSKPVRRLVAPSALIMAAACGYSDDPVGTGFMAREVTTVATSAASTSVVQKQPTTSLRQQQHQQAKEALSVVEFGQSASEDVASQKENIEDEKKTADPVQFDVQELRKDRTPPPAVASNKRQSVTSDDDENNTSIAPSAFNASVAESGTTVLHTNLSKTQVNNKKTYTKSPANHDSDNRLYSDEDFLDELLADPPGDRVLSPKGISSPREALEQERQRSRSNLPEKLPVPVGSPTKLAQFKMDREKAASYTMHAVSSPKGGGTRGVEHAASLDYSTDGSSAFFAQDASLLLGQQFIPDDAVQQQQQQPQQLSLVRKPQLQPIQAGDSLDDDDDGGDESAMLSLQESSSSVQSVVPTDEELFSVGWAKALDPNSGNYYYFTLDRTRTVWENPLSESQWGGELPPPVIRQQPVVPPVDP